MSWDKADLLYEGKAKKIFAINGEEDLIWQDFKDSFTAFNGEKKATMEGKGKINRQIASLIFQKLADQGIASHWVADMDAISMVTRKLEMIDLEVVVRNRLAGSTAKKFGIEEGADLKEPLVEFYYKKDELGDPFISDEQALMLNVVRSATDLDQLKKMALMVNRVIKDMFDQANISLVDFKLEFGYDKKGEIMLGDEISPDSCRLWDKDTQEKMDKDRFRRDLGNVLENYQEVLNRISQQ
ncbi:MAG: phosphoribosylaminoimidazolesuccinocarboxamide synthase [Bdellovibrionales bacterium]|nr:phosphoribosylaminoimidazolesuccinocarboxamide synthase [Bdellovibrionales bacterium]NQZ19718.1 phosphoribosylaminoimidazolesuccinocarboxamide synthase [Bdellovibrionales bacterium]